MSCLADKRQTGRARVVLKEQKAKKKVNKAKFLRTRMWISTILSMLEKDRGKIPPNIGNRVLITNNMYITKAFMSSIIHITYLSLKTPETLCGEIIKELRMQGSSAIVDVTFKNTDFDVNLGEIGLKSRIQVWEDTMQYDDIEDADKEVAARCLYTVDVVRGGDILNSTRPYLTIRAKTGTELSKAERIVYSYLNKIEAGYKPITTEVKKSLEYISILSSKVPEDLKDIKSLVTSEQTLAQMMPNLGSTNDEEGIYFGVNILNATAFRMDEHKISGAKNYYILAPSGVGKTVLATNMVASRIEQGYAACIMDIKGNEFTNLIETTGGYIVSLREKAGEYINSWRMYYQDTTDTDAEMYFKSRLAFSKLQMTILSGIQESEYYAELESYLDEFLESLYISLGVIASNRNTWRNTLDLNPFTVYNALLEYTTAMVYAKYPNVAKNVIMNLKKYMTRNGSKSYIFNKEFDYSSILKSTTLSFDFGILTQSDVSSVDPVLFRLRFAYMRKLNAEFVTYKHSKGILTVKVLEESQIVSDDILQGYVEEITLRRAQGQINILLGNSITALVDNPISRPMIENMRAIFIGELPHEARETVIKQFDLQEQRKLLEKIGSSPEYSNSFLFINRMQKGNSTPIIKVILDSDKKYRLYSAKKQKNVLVQ